MSEKRREREEGRGAEKEREREGSVKIVKREGWGNEVMVNAKTGRYIHYKMATY